MDNEALQNLVERLTRELLLDSEKKKVRKKVLLIFCDSSAHEAFMDQLISLKKQEIDYDLMFLDGETSAWIGIHQIQSTGAETIIAADEYAKAPIELPKDYDAIVIPEIDLDNAARVCNGLKGSVKAEIIFSALVLGKPVIIGEESPGLKRADRKTLQALELPAGYRKQFNRYISELKELGIQFCKQKDLPIAIHRLFEGIETKEIEEVLIFKGRVLTESDVGEFSILHVNENTIITPLAKDRLRDRGITLRCLREENV